MVISYVVTFHGCKGNAARFDARLNDHLLQDPR